MGTEYQIINYGSLQGSIRRPIETDIQFQRAFGASIDRLPTQSTEQC